MIADHGPGATSDTGGHAGTPRDAAWSPITDSEPRPLPAPVAPQVTALTAPPRPAKKSNSPIAAIRAEVQAARTAEARAKREAAKAAKAAAAVAPAEAAPEATPDTDTPAAPKRIGGKDRAEALLRYAGISPSDVPGTEKIVTLAEAEAEVARRGLNITLPEPLPPLTADEATACVAPMIALGAHLLRVHPGRKAPVDGGWQNAEALTESEAVDWLAAGGNLGINLGRSGPNGWIALDAENAAAADILTAVGLTPTAVTASAQDETFADQKHGGIHVWFPLPDDAPSLAGTSKLKVVLASGGMLDALHGAHQVLAPGSRLNVAPGYRYRLLEGGAALNHAVWIHPPVWLLDRTAVAPTPETGPLVGVFAPDPPRERRAPSAASDRLTQQVDAIDWAEWFDGDLRVQIIGTDGSCGCDVVHWAESSELRSGIAHDGCQFGFGFHAFSFTLQAALGGREHVSRLDFAAFLRRRTVQEVKLAMGITELVEVDLDGLVPGPRSITPPEQRTTLRGAAPTAAEAAAPTGTVAGGTVPIPEELRNTAPAAEAAPTGVPAGGPPPIGSVGGGAAGHTATPPTAAAGSPSGGDGGGSDDDEDDDDATALARAQLRELRPRVAELEKRLSTLTPGLKRAADFAESQNVFFSGFLVASLVRALATVPPNALLPPRSGCRTCKALGASANLFGVLLAPTSGGKGESTAAAAAAVPLPESVTFTGNGTGEGISHDIRAKENGEKIIKTTSLIVECSEITLINSELVRAGTKFPGWICAAGMGEPLGQKVVDDKRCSEVPGHSTRIGMILSAQPSMMGPLFAYSSVGVPARFVMGLAGLLHEAEQGALYGKEVAPVMADQSEQPWHVSKPGRPAGHLPLKDEAFHENSVPHYDRADPIWIGLPTVAIEAIRAGLERAADRAADWTLAAEQDEHMVSGHAVIAQEKLAFGLAVLDGEHNISEAHWEAAALILEISALVSSAAQTTAEIAVVDGATDSGQVKGIETAVAKAAAKGTAAVGIASTARRILKLLDRAPGGTLKPGYMRRSLSRRQQSFQYDALEQLLLTGQIVLLVDGSYRRQ